MILCLDPELVMSPGSRGDDLGGEHLGAVDYAPEIDPQRHSPVLFWSEHTAAGLETRVVHEHVHRAELRAYGLMQLA